ncbi:42156_t:CDS:1 [Gigaspora margarita]|uniref:42156_t:CDS:1 n=1 Tax=Gigaspora margarita TaxID=4874 RepID=A0ABN7VTH6_GIGMA|nr:42156_t:CDS:1 [Gigaspora margarita]
MDSSNTLFHIPDCINEIIYYLFDDRKALFSCALVNRLWCRTVIPILWSNVFNNHLFHNNKEIKIIHTYIKCLPEIQKLTLINKNINLQDFKPALFDYPKYLRVLNCLYFDNALYSWYNATIKPGFDITEYQNTFLHCNQIISQYILNHSTGLNSLHLSYHYTPNRSCFMHFPLDPSSVKEIWHAFSELTELHINFPVNTLNISLLYEKLSLYSHNIQKLNITSPGTHLFCQPDICKHLFQLINSQRNLRSLAVFFSWPNSQSPLFFSALSSQFHSLRHLEITDFYDIPLLITSYLSYFNLDTLKLIYCYKLNLRIDPGPLPFLSPGSQFQIKNLIISGAHYSALNPFFSLIIKITGSNLQKIFFNGCDIALINTIAEYNTNLTYLSTIVNYSIFDNFLLSLSKLKKLKYLEIKKSRNDRKFTNRMISQFAKSIPNTLEELNFNLKTARHIFENDLNLTDHLSIFLKDCNIPLSKLTIHMYELNNDSLNLLIDYAVRFDGSLKELRYDAEGRFTRDVLLKAEKVIPLITDITEDMY